MMTTETAINMMEMSMQEIILANKVLKTLDKEPDIQMRNFKKEHFEWVIKNENELIDIIKKLM